MEKAGYIEFWMNHAEEDWDVVEILLASQKSAQALFWGHLVCEKLCKAIWIKHHESNVPPRTHNLNFLMSKIPVEADDELKKIMLKINQYNIAGRYPGEIEEMEFRIIEQETNEIFDEMKKLRIWLLNQLP